MHPLFNIMFRMFHLVFNFLLFMFEFPFSLFQILFNPFLLLPLNVLSTIDVLFNTISRGMFLRPDFLEKFSSTDCTDRSRRTGLFLLSSHFTLFSAFGFRETFSKGKEFFVLGPCFDFVIGHRVEDATVYFRVMMSDCIPLIEKVGLFEWVCDIIRIDDGDFFSRNTTLFRHCGEMASTVTVVDMRFRGRHLRGMRRMFWLSFRQRFV